MALWNGTSTSPQEALAGINTLGYGYVGMIIVVSVWLIAFSRNPGETIKDRIAGASFMSAMVALLLFPMGMVSDVQLGFFIVVSVASLIPLINREGGGL